MNKQSNNRRMLWWPYLFLRGDKQLELKILVISGNGWGEGLVHGGGDLGNQRKEMCDCLSWVCGWRLGFSLPKLVSYTSDSKLERVKMGGQEQEHSGGREGWCWRPSHREALSLLIRQAMFQMFHPTFCSGGFCQECLIALLLMNTEQYFIISIIHVI